MIPDQGSVPLTPIGHKSTKSFQTVQTVTPRQSRPPSLSANQNRSKSFEEYETEISFLKQPTAEPPQGDDYKHESIKSIAQRFGPTAESRFKTVKKSTFEVESKDDMYPMKKGQPHGPGNYQNQLNYNVNQPKPVEWRQSSPELPEKEFILHTRGGPDKYSYDEMVSVTKYGAGQKPKSPKHVEHPSGAKAPQLLKRLPPVLKKNEGDSARLEIEISVTEPQPQVTWFKDDLHVHNKPDTRITSNFGLHTLIIPEVFCEDSGLYKVLVSSPLGTVESVCQLIVEGFNRKNYRFFNCLNFE